MYAIAIDSPERQPINTRVNPEALREITAESGGRTEIVRNSADLNDATARIAEELNSQYVLGFEAKQLDGKVHKLAVKMKQPGMTARARRSYLATAAPSPSDKE